MFQINKLLFCLALLLLGGCSRPRIIPDVELAMIFRDAFVANSYFINSRTSLDSIKLYEPIFKSYGYSNEDVQRTIANFSKRKSARLSDVVEQAIALIDKQNDYYTREVAILDTIDNVSRRAVQLTLYSDSLIRVRSLRDTTRLKVVLADIKPGEYKVSLRYEVDSMDENTISMRGGVWFERNRKGNPDLRTFSLRRDREDLFERTLVADTADRKLILNFAGFAGKPKRPSLTIRDLKIIYIPPALEAADSFYRQQTDMRIFSEWFFSHGEPKDSL